MASYPLFRPNNLDPPPAVAYGRGKFGAKLLLNKS